MTAALLEEARHFLSAVGYGDETIDPDYPIWLGRDRGIARLDLVAFGRSSPRDMSTAVVTVTSGTVDDGYEAARTIAAPYFLMASGDQLDLWVAEPSQPRRWMTDVTAADSDALTRWLTPSAALSAKVGLRQMALFDVPVNLLAAARSNTADRLAPIVGDALQAAGLALPTSRAADPVQARRVQHRKAARLVVGALTILVMRDQARRSTSLTGSLVARAIQEHSTTFAWIDKATQIERSVLESLVDQLGSGINYQSLDPAILSHVYEQALVDDDDRKQLGIHYTPPGLALRLLEHLPVELIAPDDRHVLDPACGSGTLLVAAHDRLRELQPQHWSDDARHADLAVHLHGYDIDPFASEIARLTLLLNAQPAGNGWQIDDKDTLRQPRPQPQPSIVVTNPPWRYSTEDHHREQLADRFMQWSINALAPGGLLGAILPASWLSVSNSSGTRSQLLEQFEVFEVWRLPEGTFATSNQSPAVVLARKRDGLGGTGARVISEVGRADLNGFLAGAPAAVRFLTSTADTALHEVASVPGVHKPTVPLGEIASVLSGQQPLSGISDRGVGTPYLDHIGAVPSYGLVTDDVLWRVDFPGDFQGNRGARIVRLRKILASAARSSNNPWRFRVAVDLVGVAVRNSVRGIAPLDQSDDDLLFALPIIIGSGFGSSYAASFGGDRNISAAVLRNLPVPADRQVLNRLGQLGRKATELASEPTAISELLAAAENVVWDAYGVDEADRAVAVARLAGHPAPDGAIRYPPEESRRWTSRAGLRRLGSVLGVKGSAIQLWVNGVTPEEGTIVRLPVRMPGWLARPGATFDVTGVETVGDLDNGDYRFQSMSWRDLDYESSEPLPLVSTDHSET